MTATSIKRESGATIHDCRFMIETLSIKKS